MNGHGAEELINTMKRDSIRLIGLLLFIGVILNLCVAIYN